MFSLLIFVFKVALSWILTSLNRVLQISVGFKESRAVRGMGTMWGKMSCIQLEVPFGDLFHNLSRYPILDSHFGFLSKILSEERISW